jgi:hypothetical protein
VDDVSATDITFNDLEMLVAPAGCDVTGQLIEVGAAR